MKSKVALMFFCCLTCLATAPAYAKCTDDWDTGVVTVAAGGSDVCLVGTGCKISQRSEVEIHNDGPSAVEIGKDSHGKREVASIPANGMVHWWDIDMLQTKGWKSNGTMCAKIQH